MCSPHLADPVERILRDPLRKLGWDDRLMGALRLCIEQGAPTNHLGMGIQAAVRCLAPPDPWMKLEALWREQGAREPEIRCVRAELKASGESGHPGG
jgi:mannitol-1-phosphate 5-dehydrogenase